ncbi:MAG TPA: GNAT family N-acetyltransferase [Dehalococcoidia bacterium]|nr:GNAT family N-acetyltransferase [Dehalococcoidia bacterium]
MTTTVEGEVARGELIVLRQKRLGDAHDDFRWRTDAELARYDAARPFAATYQDYLALYRDELSYPSPYRRSLAIEDTAGRHIGNAMYYNIDTIRRETEIGITIGERAYWGKGYGSDAVRTLLRHIIRVTGFRRVYLKTLDWNTRAQRAFEKAGFRVCGRSRRAGNTFVVMEYMAAWADVPDGSGRP